MASQEIEARRGAYDLAKTSADFPEWQGLPSRSLVVCTQMRSGSTLLGEGLYFAGGLGCPLEYFNPGFRERFERSWGAEEIGAYVKLAHRFRTDPSGVFSVKLFWQDLVGLSRELKIETQFGLERVVPARVDDAVYRRLYRDLEAVCLDPVFIFLLRTQEVRQAVSTHVAAETGWWRQFHPPNDLPDPRYNFGKIAYRLAQIQANNRHWRNFFRVNQLEYHSVTYEELSDNYEARLSLLLADLGRADAAIRAPRLQKQSDDASEALLGQFLAEFRQRTR
jgi:LPS sulfotransferase NodH